MNERVQKVKQHLSDYKAVYIVGAGCLVVGVVGGVAVAKHSALVNVNPKQILTYKSTQTVEVFVEALGDPGNIVQDTTTGIIYASQGQAARELGVSPSRISEHLAGKLPNVKGHTFTLLGKAAVASQE